MTSPARPTIACAAVALWLGTDRGRPTRLARAPRGRGRRATSTSSGCPTRSLAPTYCRGARGRGGRTRARQQPERGRAGSCLNRRPQQPPDHHDTRSSPGVQPDRKASHRPYEQSGCRSDRGCATPRRVSSHRSKSDRASCRSSVIGRPLCRAHNSAITGSHDNTIDPTTATVALRKRARRPVRRPGAAKAIMPPAPARRDRRDSDVALGVVPAETAQIAKAVARRMRGFGRGERTAAPGLLVLGLGPGYGCVRRRGSG